MEQRGFVARFASAGATLVLVVCAVTLTVIAVSRERAAPVVMQAPRVSAQPDWMSYAAEGNRIGRTDARAVLVEFSDFQCPACAALEDRLRSTRAKFGDDFAVVYRHYPLPNHREARAASVASECASRQGRFVEMHGLLFGQPDSIGAVSWVRLAARAGVADTSKFGVCMNDPTALQVVQRDIDAAGRLGATGTPTILIAGARYAGVPPQALLDSLVESAIRASDRR